MDRKLAIITVADITLAIKSGDVNAQLVTYNAPNFCSTKLLRRPPPSPQASVASHGALGLQNLSCVVLAAATPLLGKDFALVPLPNPRHT